MIDPLLVIGYSKTLPMVSRQQAAQLARTYLGLVFKHWWTAIITAIGGLFVVLDLADAKIDPPAWLGWTLLIGGVFVAQFLVWLDMRRERDALRRFNISQDILSQIADQRRALISMQNEELSSERDLGAWIQRYEDYRHEVFEYLRDNISPAEALLFQRLGTFPLVPIAGHRDVNFEHTHWKSRIVRDYQWLERLVQDYSRQRFRPDGDTTTDSTAPSS